MNEISNCSRHSSKSFRRAATLGTSMSLLVVAIGSMAAPGSQAATARAASTKCHIIVTGAHWSIPAPGGRITGDKYKVAAVGMSCTSARPWAIKFTHARVKASGQTLKGPRGFTCISYSEPVPYTGVCTHPPHNHPYFGWAPKTK
jgi:hypothetical protein